MCYYDNYQYACRDWKWGNFRMHCQKEYRTGETCGMKMIFQTVPLNEKCTQCEKIEKKKRRRQKALDDIARWERDGGKLQASIEKARDDVRALEAEITAMIAEKDRRYATIGNTRRAA
ncbi:hypothetical protein M409DRAFT_30239 [Zasmidium cellare ATCC 36951]|uniref:Uncharacterized protein n=1 Tax=Zasmidium cellare ATCC 36951 TaxID=1080233 RepID=A0A6A6BWP0_ZASCE|nr:uncharacterized protein M409DRAFT_30239 [Zasmidium cellare ATCC 36951]KAF2159231.1 hypothetical protein M409DRAFT_30239 [Zasmidium cellare ATCC 36951]